MAADDKKRYYWLKLHKDFFKRHEIKIVEDMPNGKEYILFYLKLLVESVTHEGKLRFSDTIPYNVQMLASLTNTNIDIVKSAMQIFLELKMIEVLDDETIYMTEVEQLIGSETGAAARKREQRAIGTDVGQLGDIVPKRLDIRDKSIEYKDNIVQTKRFVKPTVSEIEDYCKQKGYEIDAEYFYSYYESKGWLVGKAPMKNWKAALGTWVKNNKNWKVKKSTIPDVISPYPKVEDKIDPDFEALWGSKK